MLRYSIENKPVLRFSSHSAERAKGRQTSDGLSSRLRWRLWLLLICLGLVLSAMRELNKPTTVQRLEQIFGTAESDPISEAQHQLVFSTEANSSALPETLGKSSAPAKSMLSVENIDDELSQIQDNTYFRLSETAAWFRLFERLQNSSAEELSSASMGEVTYTQLLKQPNAYRGQVVMIRGTLRREEVERPADNTLGITSYHRLVIQPRGGGHWPFIVYCLKLPGELPRGDDLQLPVEVNGLFFKNWSYAWQEGLGIAPVVLARNIEWHPSPSLKPRQPVTKQSFVKAIAVACGFAALVVFFVMHNTRRSPRRSSATPTINLPEQLTIDSHDEKLQWLSHQEPEQ